MKKITYELQMPIMYASKGSDIEANFIELHEPTGKVSNICCDIESLVQSSIMKMSNMLDADTIETAKAEAKTKPKEEEPDGDAIMAIMMGGGADMQKIILHFRELFKTVAFVGGEKEMTIPLMDKMSHKDFRKMVGVYAANFILN